MTRQKILDRARDELFSHVNRCGVLQAAAADQEQWMNETIDYLGERFPDLTEGDLRDLYDVGIRFCQPAIPHGAKASMLPEGEEVEVTETVAEGVLGIDAVESPEAVEPEAVEVA